jgi:carboxylesterase type B
MYYTISFVLLILVIHQNQAQNAKVTVENGLIEGKTLSFDGNHVNAFLGIPYAEPPVGDLRFKKPVPKGKWTQTLKVQNWSNACQQSDLAVESFENKNRSEDCLYLNIYSPNDSKSGLKAVMFWLHGGAFIMGSAVQSNYDPLVLSTKGDVVVVTINYRFSKIWKIITTFD